MLEKVTQQILDELPKETKITSSDIEVIKKNKDFLFSKAEYIVKDFYDTLFGNAKTAAVFNEGERPIREKSLTDWLVKTVTGDFDLDYWQWQTYVGILHVKRKVTNNMMIVMMGRVSDIISTEAIKELDAQDAIDLKHAWSKFSGTVLALIGESYNYFYMQSVSNTTGLSTGLLENSVRVEIDNLVNEYKNHRL